MGYRAKQKDTSFALNVEMCLLRSNALKAKYIACSVPRTGLNQAPLAIQER